MASRQVHIDRLLEVTCKRHANELRLNCGSPPRIYVDGQFHEISTIILDQDKVLDLLRTITPDAVQAQWREKGEANFTFAFGDLVRFRVRVSGRDSRLEIVIRPFASRHS